MIEIVQAHHVLGHHHHLDVVYVIEQRVEKVLASRVPPRAPYLMVTVRVVYKLSGGLTHLMDVQSTNSLTTP